MEWVNEHKAGSEEAGAVKIRVEDVSFSYQNEQILKGISLDIREGDFICLLGTSGCGKSTLLSLLEGLNVPSSGQVTIDGKAVKGPGLDRSVVFQDYSLFPWMSTGNNVLLALKQAFKKNQISGNKKGQAAQREHLTEGQLKERVLYYFRLVGLDHVYHKLPGELSGGMRQRAAIARAFSIDAPILLMDEPFGALDAITRSSLQELLTELWRKEHKTVVFVTHDVDEALFLATRIIILGDGKVQMDLPVVSDVIRYRELFFRETETMALKEKILRYLDHTEKNRFWSYSI